MSVEGQVIISFCIGMLLGAILACLAFNSIIK